MMQRFVTIKEGEPISIPSLSFLLIYLFRTHRNAGLFIWVDLSPYLDAPTEEKDGWALEKELSDKLALAGVLMSRGEPYHNEEPGWFRLVFSRERGFVEEGLRR
jgi:DNA-binding transcriptional MocR family regulator